jgi:hypothetical protein
VETGRPVSTLRCGRLGNKWETSGSGLAMTVRIFATDVPLASGQRPDLAKLTPIVVPTWDDAYTSAARLLRGGATVWRIEEQSQAVEEPHRIVAACKARGLLPSNWVAPVAATS